jgi:hypothetical protein
MTDPRVDSLNPPIVGDDDGEVVRDSTEEVVGEDFPEPPPPPPPPPPPEAGPAVDPPLSDTEKVLREVRRQREIGTAEIRLDKETSRVQEKEEELTGAKEKLQKMGLDEKGKIPRPPGGGDIEAQNPGADPWVVNLWQYGTEEERETLKSTTWVLAAAVIASVVGLTAQVIAYTSAESNEDAAERRIAIGNAAGANSSRDTQLMNDNLGDAASETRLGATILLLGSVSIGVTALGVALIKYYGMRQTMLARIKEQAKKYEEGSAELAKLTENVEKLKGELNRLDPGRRT